MVTAGHKEGCRRHLNMRYLPDRHCVVWQVQRVRGVAFISKRLHSDGLMERLGLTNQNKPSEIADYKTEKTNSAKTGST
jgi:hypothetical protein